METYAFVTLPLLQLCQSMHACIQHKKYHLMRCMWCAALPTPEQLDQTELRFLEDFCNLMVTAHYRLLTEQEWQTATDEEFTVSSSTACPHLHSTLCISSHSDLNAMHLCKFAHGDASCADK